MNNLGSFSNVVVTPPGSSAPTQIPDVTTRLLDARTRLHDAANAAQSKSSLLSAAAAICSNFCKPDGIVFVHRDGEDSAPRLDGLGFPAAGLNDELQSRILEAHQQAERQGNLRIEKLSEQPQLFGIAAPVLVPGQPAESLVVVHSRSSEFWESAIALTELAASYIRSWQIHQQLTQAHSNAQTTRNLIESLSSVAACEDIDTASKQLVNELHTSLGCQQVALGLVRDGETSCRVRAVSGDVVFDPRSDSIRALEAALDEAIIRDTVTVWPPSDSLERHALLAHKKLGALTSTETIVSSAIRDKQDRLQGAWLFLAEAEFRNQPDKLEFIKAAEVPVGSTLHLLKRTERSKLARLTGQVLELPKRRKGRAVMLAVAVVLAVLALPVPYRVKCACELQPVARRFVAAPFEGRLEKCHVEPGDIVSTDQLLVEMDGREIRWELAGIVADQNRADKQRDAHLANHDFGSAQLSKLEMERLDLKAQLLEHRAENLQIRSPIDGIVISGDLKKAEGMPLTVGQSLFEIAPLNDMIVEVAIPEEDIAYVTAGLETNVVLDAFPEQSWRGTVARIHPRSEVRDQEHVFVGEMRLANQNGALRPGMRGLARIVGPKQAIAWNLFHKPWDKLRLWVGF